MLQQAYNVVVKYLKEHYPSLPTDFGVIHDLYCMGFALLFQEEIDYLNSLLDNIDIRNYKTMPESALDRIAANFLLARSTGAKATAMVRVTVPVPVAVSLPLGTGFVTVDGLRFFSTQAVSWSRSQVGNQAVGSAFYFDVPVEAEENGEQYNVSAGAISSALVALPFQVTSISNNSAATKGTDKETNEEFYFRIVGSVNTRDLLVTKMSISTVLEDAYPTLRRVSVVGKGDDLMERDIVYGIAMPGGFNPYRRSDFSGKKAGVTRYNRSVAKYGSLTDEMDATMSLEDVEGETTECSQDDYTNLLALDLDYLIIPGALIYEDSFEPDVIPTMSYYDYEIVNWIASDSGFHYGTRRLGTSVSIHDGKLILGAVDLAAVEI